MASPIGLRAHTPNQDDLDFLVQSSRKESDDVVRQRLQRFVIEAVSSPLRLMYETESAVNYRYLENDFYTAQELAELEERGQPPTKRNECAPIIEKLCGQFIKTRQVITPLARNAPSDDIVSANAQDHMRWNDQRNMYEFEEQDMAYHGLVGGVGWVKHFMKTDEYGAQYECKRSVDPYTIFKDPYSKRYDLNDDAKYIVEGGWCDVEDVIALCPDKIDEIQQVAHSARYLGPRSMSTIFSALNTELLAPSSAALSVEWYGNMRYRLRPFEIWYKRKVQVYHLYKDNTIIPLTIPLDAKAARDAIKQMGRSIEAKPAFVDRMYTGTILGDLILHHDITPYWHDFYPYVPFYSGLRKNGLPLALQSRLSPINEAINKRESKALALLTNRQWMAEKSAIEDDDEFTSELARPEGKLIVRDGALSGNAPKVIIRDNLELGQSQMGLLQEDKDALRRVSGQSDESLGMASEVRSGVGIARKQAMGDLISQPLHNNLKRTRMIGARLSFCHLKQYVTVGMSFRITDDARRAEVVEFTHDVVNMLKELDFDLVMDETKDYAVIREQQSEMFLTVLPQLAQLGPHMVKLGIHLTEFRPELKETLVKMVEENSQPQPNPPKMSLSFTWSDLSPEERAFFALSEFKSQELAQVILAKGGDPAYLAKLKAEIAKTQIAEGTRATIERGRLDLSALTTATEGRLAMRQMFAEQEAFAQSNTNHGGTE